MTPRELADELELFSQHWRKGKTCSGVERWLCHNRDVILAALRFQAEVDDGIEELRASPPDPFDPEVENDPSWDRGFELGWQLGKARGEQELTDAQRLAVIDEIRTVEASNPSGWAAMAEYERRVKERVA